MYDISNYVRSNKHFENWEFFKLSCVKDRRNEHIAISSLQETGLVPHCQHTPYVFKCLLH